MTERTCGWCGVDISKLKSTAQYCSTTHKRAAGSKRHRERNPGYHAKYADSSRARERNAQRRASRARTDCIWCKQPMENRRGRQLMCDGCQTVGVLHRCRTCLVLKTLSQFGRVRGSVQISCSDCKAKEQNRRHRAKLGAPEDATTDELRARWRAGRYIHKSSGYVYVLAHGHHRANRDGFVMEHVLVAEKRYGIPITREYTVHHRNAVRTDNRPENLDLRVGPHGVGGDVMPVLMQDPELREQARLLLAEYDAGHAAGETHH